MAANRNPLPPAKSIASAQPPRGENFRGDLAENASRRKPPPRRSPTHRRDPNRTESLCPPSFHFCYAPPPRKRAPSRKNCLNKSPPVRCASSWPPNNLAHSPAQASPRRKLTRRKTPGNAAAWHPAQRRKKPAMGTLAGNQNDSTGILTAGFSQGEAENPISLAIPRHNGTAPPTTGAQHNTTQ